MKLKVFQINVNWPNNRVTTLYVADFSAEAALDRAKRGMLVDVVSPVTLGEAKPSRAGLARCRYLPCGYLP